MAVLNTTSQTFNESTSPPGEMSLVDKLFILSDDQRRLADSIQKPLGHVLVGMAIPLMVCNIVVFSQKSIRSASALYIIGMNYGQLIYVVTTTVNFVWSLFVVPKYSSYAQCLWDMYAFIYIGVMLAKRGSYMIVCLASAERLYAVLRPLHVKSFLLAKRPVLCMIVVYLMTVMFHMYHVTKYGMSMEFSPSMGVKLCQLRRTDFYLRHKELNDFMGNFARGAYEYASLCVQLLLNALTVWALRRHNKATKSMQSSTNEDAKRQHERQLTITLLGASVSYLTCSLPAAVTNMISTNYDTYGPYKKYHHLYFVLADFTFNMTVLGSGVDFFCYLGLSSTYRATLKRLLHCGDENRFSVCGHKCQIQSTTEKRVIDISKTEMSAL